jgi:hypothetical protein
LTAQLTAESAAHRARAEKYERLSREFDEFVAMRVSTTVQ